MGISLVAYLIPYDRAQRKSEVHERDERDEPPSPEPKRSKSRALKSLGSLKGDPKQRTQQYNSHEIESDPSKPVLSQEVVRYFEKNWTLRMKHKRKLGVQKTHRGAKLKLTLIHAPDEPLRIEEPEEGEQTVDENFASLTEQEEPAATTPRRR